MGMRDAYMDDFKKRVGEMGQKPVNPGTPTFPAPNPLPPDNRPPPWTVNPQRPPYKQPGMFSPYDLSGYGGLSQSDFGPQTQQVAPPMGEAGPVYPGVPTFPEQNPPPGGPPPWTVNPGAQGRGTVSPWQSMKTLY